MPVSPQDFELYSRMTGAPMPSDAMSRMQMAPEVYKFTKDFARKPNLLQKTGNLVKNIGRTAVMAVGAPMVAESLAEQERMSRQAREQASQPQVTMSGGEEAVVEREKTPAEIIEDKRMERLKLTYEKKKEERDDKQKKAMELLKAKKEDLVDTPQFELVGVQEEDVQQPTTADEYNQNRTNSQTAIGQIDRKNEQAAKLATTVTVADTLAKSQDSSPSPLSSRYGSQLDPADLEEIGSSDIRGRAAQIIKKAKTKTDPLLALAFSQADQKEELIDDTSILTDNVDSAADGGEDQSNVPSQNNYSSSGINTSSTLNLNQKREDIKNMIRRGAATLSPEKQEELADKMMSPSNRQINLLEKRRIANEEAKASGFMNLDDEGRKKESIRLGSTGGIPNKTDMQEIRKSPEYQAAQETMLPKTTNEKADGFTARFVEGAQSDIVRGQRGNRSLGITRIPATNGDAQTGFVLANKPIDKSPTTATTYGFGVAPGAEDMLKNQLNESSFDMYMDRGMSEAKQGKKRKAGEIFEFLPVKNRIVSGKADLGDIVM